MGSLDPSLFLVISCHFSPRTSLLTTRQAVEAQLEHRRKGVLAPPFGMKALVFIDDLHSPLPQKLGAQPPIELLRQCADQGGWYDTKSHVFNQLVDVVVMGAMSTAAAGRAPFTARYLRHFSVIAVVT